MKDLNKLANSYSLLDMNIISGFCHSIDKEKYRILCENFFCDKKVNSKFIEIAEENIVFSNQSEEIFLYWLNLE